MTIFLEAKNIACIRGGRRIFRDLNLSVKASRITVLMGENGSGKSTALELLAGLIAPNAGMIVHKGENITALPLHARARRGIGWMAQEKTIFAGLDALDSVLMLLEAAGVPRKARRKRAISALREVGLEHRAGVGVKHLSGGEQRRVQIAGVFALEPHVLLLDEPFSGLDERSVERLQRALRARAARGIGILVTEHRRDICEGIKDELLEIREGGIRRSMGEERIDYSQS